MPRLYRAEQHEGVPESMPVRCAMPRLYRAEQQ